MLLAYFRRMSVEARDQIGWTDSSPCTPVRKRMQWKHIDKTHAGDRTAAAHAQPPHLTNVQTVSKHRNSDFRKLCG